VLAASTVAAIAGKAWLPDPWYVLAGTLAGMAAAVFLAQGRDA
jgi:predicted branched-subunit amino acid permease